MSKALKNKVKLNDVVSVKDFGAVGDGVTDDTAAIQSAVNDAAGKSLYVPSGTYRLDSNVTVSSQLLMFGDGRDNSKFTGVGRFILAASF